MNELDGSIPVETAAVADVLATEDAEKNSSTLDDEKQIEEEVLLSEKKIIAEEEEGSSWDGSESEFVEDSDAEEYEEKYTGIKFGYALKREEIFSCLKHTGQFKANGTREIVEICLLLVLATMFLILFFVTRNNFNIILGVISVALAFFVVLIPRFFVGLNADKFTTGKKLSVEIYPDEIAVTAGAVNWKIPLDGSCVFEEFNDMFFLFLPKEKLFVIPIRAIEPDVLADVQAMIVAGTTPKEQE